MPGSWHDYLELRRGDGAPAPSSEDGDVRIYADSGGDLRSVQSDGTDAPIGGGGSQAYVGATITLSSDTDLTGGDPIPFDAVACDSGGFADLADNRLVVPAGKGGVYLYGFSVACHTTHGGSEFEVLAVPSGLADLLVARWTPTFTTIFLTFADSCVEPFADGDHLAVTPNWLGGNDPFTFTFTGGTGGSSACKLFMTRLGDTPS